MSFWFGQEFRVSSHHWQVNAPVYRTHLSNSIHGVGVRTKSLVYSTGAKGCRGNCWHSATSYQIELAAS